MADHPRRDAGVRTGCQPEPRHGRDRRAGADLARCRARSAHPQTSFAAVGGRACDVVARHPFGCALGTESPLGALEAMDAVVLLLGVGYDSCTCFHLAEYRQDDPPGERVAAAVCDDSGSRVWKTWTDVALDDEDFEDIGADLEANGAVSVGRVGAATSHLFSMRDAVAHATTWMTDHRPRPT
ncbi:AAC(3) family N-acetyltransferase [Microbacterium sp. NPDC056234]|uniref:AAC(3) family N-acetyltransferase n=1 Tax=Microbacterium sp. NPDC056234 TaxID=3345757 RepID=UPI0035D8D754